MFDSILCIAHSLLEHEVTWRFFQFPIHLVERPIPHSGFESSETVAERPGHSSL